MSDRELLISQYIDNELSLSEKAEFIKEINGSDAYCADALGMLEMEMAMPIAEPPAIKPMPKRSKLGISLMAAAASVMIFAGAFMLSGKPEAENASMHRFVIYEPSAKSMTLTGSFNSWQQVQMQETGEGYWQVFLPLKQGEYSYNYIADERIILPDPTVSARQNDGFGSVNSIITIGEKI